MLIWMSQKHLKFNLFHNELIVSSSHTNNFLNFLPLVMAQLCTLLSKPESLDESSILPSFSTIMPQLVFYNSVFNLTLSVNSAIINIYFVFILGPGTQRKTLGISSVMRAIKM